MSDHETPAPGQLETPTIEVTIAAPVEVVWHALRNKEKIRHWHGWEADGLDDEIDLIYFGEVVEDSAARTLDVQGGDVFTLTPVGDGTRVTITRAPLSGDGEWDAYYDDVTEGWITFLHQLRFLLERQPGTPRRTLFFSGGAGATGPITEQLGLAHVAGRPPGTDLTATLVGEQIKGEKWFESDHQIGITVDAWGGDGLLIASYVPASETKPNGAVMAVLSTYGLDDGAFDELSRRWSAWWAERYR